jgi:hypothetical protein
LDPQSVLDPRREKKSGSCASHISSTSVLSHDTKTSKVSEKDNQHDFYPKNFNHAFLPKLDFEGYRNNAKKEFEENQNCIGDEEFHQEPEHPSTFMKMVKGRTRTMSAVNVERRQLLPSKVIWDGTIDRFEVFRNNIEGHYGQIGAAYLFDSRFQEAYLERGVDCYVDFLNELPSASQIKKDARALYIALNSAFQSGVGRRILMENRDKQDGIRSCCQLVQQYETDGNRNFRIKRLESVINTVFHRNYRGGPVKRIQDYEDAFTELALLGQRCKRLGMMMTTRSIGLYRTIKILVLVDTVFEELVSGKSFIETCDLLRSHAIRLDQQYKEKASRQIHNTSQLSNRSKKDKVKKILALINEIQIQDSCSSDED